MRTGRRRTGFVEIVCSTNISGVAIGAIILIGIGVIVLVKAFILHED